MTRSIPIFGVLGLLALTAHAEETAGSIALLVNEASTDVIAARLAPALASKDPVVRSAASRVALVRGMTAVLPQIRDALAIESNPNAAREEVRALVILGDAADVDGARAATRKLPPAIDAVIAEAVARRLDAFEIYAKSLRPAGYIPDPSFFIQALWRRPAAAVASGSRLLGMRDAAAWRSLLAALLASHLAMQPGVLGASLNASSEEIRTASVWYLARAYTLDPSMIHESVRAILGAPTEEASTREAFGRELLRRMSGAERKDDPRWLAWLDTAEPDPLLASDESLFAYFTEKEYLARKNHCGIVSYDCRMPPNQPGRTIPSTMVAEPPFFLPEVLPPGVAGAVVAEMRCNGEWLALANATVDTAGRAQNVAIKRVQMNAACEKAVNTLIRLSLATPGSMMAPLIADNILLVHSGNRPPCLDEAPLGATGSTMPVYAGGEVTAPIAKHREEPHFPPSARQSMGRGTMVIIILRCIISREGCVRAVQLIKQSPFPELNGAALQAISKWTFEPGRLAGNPVDVVFNLTVNFRTG